MESNTRSRILLSVAALIIVGIGVWWYFGFSLEFMRFFAAEPSSVPQAPTDITCTASSADISSGQTVTVMGSGAKNEAYQWSAPEGALVSGQGTATAVIRYDTPGTKRILVVGIPSYSNDDSIQNFASCEVVVR